MEIQRRIAIIKAEIRKTEHKLNAYNSVLKNLEKELEKLNKKDNN